MVINLKTTITLCVSNLNHGLTSSQYLYSVYQMIVFASMIALRSMRMVLL